MDRCQASFAEAFSYRALAVAWQRVRSNDGAAGGDGVAIADFMRGERANLLTLQRSLSSGHYRPGPLRRVEIPKKDGGLRELAIPCVADRIAQTAWLFALSPAIDPAMSASSFAYRPARSVRMALQAVRRHIAEGRVWVVDADIWSFFDRVPHARLLDELRRWVTDARLRALVALWLRRAAPGGRGLPQGSPISPVLANIYLDSLDRWLATAGIVSVRYADDFVLLCRTRVEAKAARAAIGRQLATRGLALNSGKTRVCRADAGVRFLGEWLTPARPRWWARSKGRALSIWNVRRPRQV